VISALKGLGEIVESFFSDKADLVIIAILKDHNLFNARMKDSEG